jgi:Leucine-rich repeat (LRR) protein
VWTNINEMGLPAVLKVLDVSKNDLKSFPPELANCTQLKTLICSHCELQRTTDVRHLTALAKLDLEANNLEESTLKPLPAVSLVRLNLANNHFTLIHTSVLVELVNLKELDLSNNRVQSTEGLGQLVRLNILILDNNLLTELTEDLAALTSLKRISVKHNKIGKRSTKNPDAYSIPEAFLVNSSVEKIELTGNTNLRNNDLMQFDGMNAFLERRNKAADKNFATGGMVSFNVFGLDG